MRLAGSEYFSVHKLFCQSWTGRPALVSNPGTRAPVYTKKIHPGLYFPVVRWIIKKYGIKVSSELRFVWIILCVTSIVSANKQDEQCNTQNSVKMINIPE